jgi:hypothetical protein
MFEFDLVGTNVEGWPLDAYVWNKYGEVDIKEWEPYPISVNFPAKPDLEWIFDQIHRTYQNMGYP